MAGEWGRFTRHAKKSVIDSQDLAVSLGSGSVYPEHLVLALLDDSGTTAALVIALTGVPGDDLRSLLEERCAAQAEGEDAVEKPPFSTALKQVVERAGELSGGEFIGTEHLLAAAFAPGTALGETSAEALNITEETFTGGIQLLEQHEVRLRAGANPAAEPAPALARTPVGSPSPVNTPAASAPKMVVPGPPPADSGVAAAASNHTLSALARLVVDLAGKAATLARSHGSPALADQLDRMRSEVENQIRSTRPASQIGETAKAARIDG